MMVKHVKLTLPPHFRVSFVLLTFLTDALKQNIPRYHVSFLPDLSKPI